jgi:hypothetical protein
MPRKEAKLRKPMRRNQKQIERKFLVPAMCRRIKERHGINYGETSLRQLIRTGELAHYEIGGRDFLSDRQVDEFLEAKERGGPSDVQRAA